MMYEVLQPIIYFIFFKVNTVVKIYILVFFCRHHQELLFFRFNLDLIYINKMMEFSITSPTKAYATWKTLKK